MSLKGEDALILANQYTDDTIKGAGGLKGEPGASAYEIAVANGFEGTEQQWLESLKAEFEVDTTPTEGSANLVTSGGVYSFVPNAAKKLANTVKIGKVNFDGSTGIALSDIKGQIVSTNSSTQYANKYTKIASVDVSDVNWSYCGGIISVYSASSMVFSGLLHFTVQRGGSVNAIAALDLKWLTLSDINYANSVVAVRGADGVYDLYFKPVANNVSMRFSLSDIDYQDKITLHDRQSYVDTVEVLATSTYNVDTTPTSGSNNHITSGGVYNALGGKLDNLPASSTAYDTGRVWLNGASVMRKDFAFLIKEGSSVETAKSYSMLNIAGNLGLEIVVDAQAYVTRAWVTDDATIGTEASRYVEKCVIDGMGDITWSNTYGGDIFLSGYIEYVKGDVYTGDWYTTLS